MSYIGVARIGDKVLGDCTVHGSNIMGTIVSAATNDTINNRGVARLGDQVLADCGHQSVIVTGGPTVLSNNLQVARLGDQVAGGDGHYTGTIITASPDTTTS